MWPEIGRDNEVGYYRDRGAHRIFTKENRQFLEGGKFSSGEGDKTVGGEGVQTEDTHRRG